MSMICLVNERLTGYVVLVLSTTEGSGKCIDLSRTNQKTHMGRGFNMGGVGYLEATINQKLVLVIHSTGLH